MAPKRELFYPRMGIYDWSCLFHMRDYVFVRALENGKAVNTAPYEKRWGRRWQKMLDALMRDLTLFTDKTVIYNPREHQLYA